MFRKIALLCLIASLPTPFAYGRPDQVIIIRHAEKPDRGDDLTWKGRERAAALAPLFQSGEIGTPVAIYARGASNDHSSRRSVETVTPLARELKLNVNIHHDDYVEMVKEILTKPEYDGKVVLICWSHKKIPDLATALGIVNPPAWRGQVFDRLWIIKLKDGKATLQDLPQRLLFGDSAE